MSAPLAITGLGLIGAPGPGVAAGLAALRAGSSHLATCDDAALPLAAQLPVGRVSSPLPAASTRSAALGLAAGREALAQAGLDGAARRACGLALGTCVGGMPESEAAFARLGSAGFDPCYRHQPTAATGRALAHGLGLRGPLGVHAVACASSACALIDAALWLRSGSCDCVLVIGADALCRVTMAGFHSLQVIDPAGCRPLTQERAGMDLGEAGAALLLETPEHARRRGARVLAQLLGWGLRADAHHATAPDPTGTQLELALREALADAAAAPADLGWVCAHGTGTRDNDAVEAAVLARVLGPVPTASCKAGFGHSMGACAAVEALACALSLQEELAWPSAGAEHGTPLPGIAVVVGAPQRLRAPLVASTTLAFGGMNACLVFGPGET